jgi:glutamate carboxypeptidase
MSKRPPTVSDAELAALRGYVEHVQPVYREDLRRFVAIDCGSYSRSGVNEVGQLARQGFAELGAKVETVANAELGDTVVATFSGDPAGPSALLIGHLDTVYPDGTCARRPYVERDGRAYAPGVSDMKAGLLAGVYAIGAVQSLGRLPFSRLVFVANPDEEIGSPASRPVISRLAESADVAFVLECARANGDIVSSRKGIVDMLLRLTGRAAHAGVEPEKGRSAIVEAAHKTLALTALNGRWRGVTVNVGVIDGGTRPNVVAAEARLEIDLRAVTRTALRRAEAEIARICAATTVAEVSCTSEEQGRHWPMEKSAGTSALVRTAIGLADRLGFELHDAATGGASDANTTAGLGVPTLDGLGPIGGNDHSDDEYLELDSIVPRTTLLAALLLSAGRRPPRRAGQRAPA